MSPEQARGEPVDGRSDIFSAGVILFELTTGKRLFKGQGDYETLKLICDREYPLPSQVREGYPAELERIVMRALTKDRDARYQSAREMQQALEDFARRERIPVSTIALNQFMQSLFADKLATQTEALQQGKQLADIIEARQQDSLVPEDSRLSQSILSAPAASRTLTELDLVRRRRSTAVGIVAAFVLGGALVATWTTRFRATPPPAASAPAPIVTAAAPVVPPGVPPPAATPSAVAVDAGPSVPPPAPSAQRPAATGKRR
jgi:serine/threonine-protein kinase